MPILRKIYVGPNVYVPVVLCNARRTVYILLLLLVLCLRVLQGHYHDIDGCLCLRLVREHQPEKQGTCYQ